METSFPSSQFVRPVNPRLESYSQPVPPPDVAGEVDVSHFPFVVGRHPDCDLFLYNRQVSRRHCQFFQRGHEVLVEDLNSYNGTFLNEHELQQAEAIEDGDSLVLHPYRYRCRLEQGDNGQPRLLLTLEISEDPR